MEGDRLESSDYTDEIFLRDLNQTVEDFIRRAGVVYAVSNVEVSAGEYIFQIPTEINEVHAVLYDGGYLHPTESLVLSRLYQDWRADQGSPSKWFDDHPGPRRIGIHPSAKSDGQTVNVSTFYGTVGDGTTLFTTTQPFYGVVGSTTGATVSCGALMGSLASVAVDSDNLTVIGPASPYSPVLGLNDPIPTVPEEFVPYIMYGCLYLAFSSSNAIKDDIKARYCRYRYEEGIALAHGLSRGASET